MDKKLADEVQKLIDIWFDAMMKSLERDKVPEEIKPFHLGEKWIEEWGQ